MIIRKISKDYNAKIGRKTADIFLFYKLTLTYIVGDFSISHIPISLLRNSSVLNKLKVYKKKLHNYHKSVCNILQLLPLIFV